MSKGTPVSGTQINLELRTSERQAALVFHSGLSLVTAWFARDHWPDGRIWLSGDQSSGKTRLTKQWAQQLNGTVVSLKKLRKTIQDGKLEQLLGKKFCVVEDIPQKPSPEEQEDLFHLVSTAQSVECRLIITSRSKPAEVEWTLADIRSRALATCLVSIEVEKRQERLPLLLSALSRYQLKLSSGLVEWLCSNLALRPGVVFCAAEKLYQYSLKLDLPKNQRALQKLIVDNYPELLK